MTRLTLFFFFLFPTSLWAASACDLLREIYPHLLGTEEELLARFRPQDIVRVARPPLGKTLIVETAEGIRYIVRAPGEFSQISFEVFATEFILAAPVGRVPRVRNLGRNDVEKLMEKIPPGSFRDGIVLENVLNVSIAVFYSMEDGKSYLGGRDSANFIRNLVLSFALDKNPQENLAEWELFFPPTSMENRRAFAAELSQMGGAFAGITGENLEVRIPELIRAEGNLLAPLLEKAVHEIPMPVLRQLADQWMLITLLGIPDFHNNNWLIRNGKVLGIDVALHSEAFQEGHPLNENEYEMPFLWLEYAGPAGMKALVNWASPELIDYLRSLNENQIHELAERSGFRVTPVSMRGILVRKRELLELRD